MRKSVTIDKLKKFMQKIAEDSKGPGNIYFVGGSCALLLGIRDQTIDIDLKLDPEPKGVFEAIAKLKNELDLNIELASPDDFIPPDPDWKKNSIFIATIKGVNFYHYDITTQALAKIERGYDQDLKDVKAFIEKGLVSPEQILECLVKIDPLLLRYPAIDPKSFAKRVREYLDQIKSYRG